MEAEEFGMQITILNDQQFRIGKEAATHEFGEILDVKSKKIILIRDPGVNLKNFSSQVFYFSHKSAAEVANEYLDAVKIVQTTDQSTILDLSFRTENPELGVNFLKPS